MKNIISKFLVFITLLCLGLATPLDAMRRAPKKGAQRTRRVTEVSKQPVRIEDAEDAGSDSDDDGGKPSAKRARIASHHIEDEDVAFPTALPTPLQADVPMDVATPPHLQLPASRLTVALPPALPTALPPALPTALPPALPTALPPALPTALPVDPTVLPTALPTAPVMEIAHEAVPTVLPPPALPTALSPALPTALPPALPTAEEILQRITEITTGLFETSSETQIAFLLVLDHTFGEHMTQTIDILRVFTNARTLNPEVFNTGMNLFHLAALSGNFDIYNKLRRLLGEVVSGLLAAAQDDFGRLPLHYAFLGSKPGHLDVAFAMIRTNPALLNTQDESKLTPLEFGALNSPQKGSLVAFMTTQITQIIPDFLTTGPTGLFQKVANQFNPPPAPPAPHRTTTTPPPPEELPHKRSVLKPWTWL